MRRVISDRETEKRKRTEQIDVNTFKHSRIHAENERGEIPVSHVKHKCRKSTTKNYISAAHNK